jgi:hypothetical protein
MRPFDTDQDVVVLEAGCIKDNYKGNPDYPYRKDPRVMLKVHSLG